MTNYGKIDMLWFDGEWLALGGLDWTGEEGWFRKPDWAVGEYMRVNYFVRINHGIPVIVLRIPGDIYRAEKFFL